MNKDIGKLVTTKEKVWFLIVICLALVGLFLFVAYHMTRFYSALSFFSPVAFVALIVAGSILVVLWYLGSSLILMLITSGITGGYLGQNSVQVSRAQFADIYEIVQDYSKKLDLKKPLKFILCKAEEY
ncbi:hypothetical protein AGMMS49593_01020 [Endomicrobiia bacterium]|nr:hypothetical protein AGMMS49593_01020 [Endomicrobiia bacterium]